MLPIALAGVVAVIMLIFFTVNTGRLMIERERTRMRTDVTALSGAVVYARCLNLYVLTKKSETISDLASVLPYVGEVFAVISEFIGALKKGIKGFGPYATLGATELVAYNNGLAAVPYWNVKDFYDISALGKGISPNLNFDNNENSNASGAGGSGGDSSQRRYSYKKKSNGEVVDVEEGRVKDDTQGKARGRSRDKITGKFVKKEKGRSEGEHSLTLLSSDWFRPSEEARAGLKELPHFYSISRARVAGGNFDFLSTSSMNWGCFLAPVTVKESPAGAIDISEIPETGISSADAVIAKANLAIAEIKSWIDRVPAILH